ncbi:hypothetical protein SRHO_G00183720 [Serrasalmus rhombeus]
MVLTDPEFESSVLISSDEGASYQKYRLSFYVLSLLFHPSQEDWALAYSHDQKEKERGAGSMTNRTGEEASPQLCGPLGMPHINRGQAKKGIPAPGKLERGDHELKFLGYRVTPQGILPDMDKVRAVTAFPVPTDVRQQSHSQGCFRQHESHSAVVESLVVALENLDDECSTEEECYAPDEAVREEPTPTGEMSSPESSIVDLSQTLAEMFDGDTDVPIASIDLRCRADTTTMLLTDTDYSAKTLKLVLLSVPHAC